MLMFQAEILSYSSSPGPPAEKLPPPPIKVFMTQKRIKSGCWCDTDSRPMAMCANSGMGVGPRLTSEIKNDGEVVVKVDNESEKQY